MTTKALRELEETQDELDRKRKADSNRKRAEKEKGSMLTGFGTAAAIGGVFGWADAKGKPLAFGKDKKIPGQVALAAGAALALRKGGGGKMRPVFQTAGAIGIYEIGKMLGAKASEMTGKKK